MSIEQEIEEHDKKEDGVYLVEVFHKEKFIQHAIFSRFELAKKWIHEQPTEYSYMAAPFILDNPKAGERKKEELQ